MWKWLFFILLFLNIIILISGIALLNLKYEAPENQLNHSNQSNGNLDQIEVTLTNHQVNHFINNMLDDSMTMNIQTSGIVMNYTHTVLGFDINTRFDMEPVKLDDNIKFEISNININDIPFTQAQLYAIIVRASELPEGVTFSDEEYAILIDKDYFNLLEFDGSIEINKMDYKNNEWSFYVTDIF